jgi:hypothetical protein
MALYVDRGHRISGRAASASTRGATRRPAVAEREQNKAIRAWAVRKGMDVAPRGRIRTDIIEAYHREAGR